ncbi:MAG: hypothetical protein KY476_11225 [Planctomycetes bacterium]|nr:hypothetical protein [Planctomycetota bacterium]
MTSASFDVPAADRWFAAAINNGTWDLLEKPDRSADDNARMLHAAHAACHHWLQVGTAVNHQRALCVVAFVYAELGHGDLALQFAERCRELTEAHAAEMADFDLAFAQEALARAHAAAGRRDEAARFRQLAQIAGAAIADDEDRQIFEVGFSARNWYGIE